MSGRRSREHRRAGALPDRGPGGPDLAAGPAPLRHPGLRRQRVHRRGGRPARRRGAPRGGRARGALRRRQRPRDASRSTARSTTRPRARSCTARPGRCAARSPPSRARPCSGSARSPARSSSRRAGSGRSPASRCSTRATRRPRARELEAGLAAYPDAWQGHYNLACFEARLGNRDAALDQLERAAEIDREASWRSTRPSDEDFASLKDDPRFLAITGQAHADGAGS